MKKLFRPGDGWRIFFKNKNIVETSEQCILYLADKWLVENKQINLYCLLNGCKCHYLSEYNYSLCKAKRFTIRNPKLDIEKILQDLEDANLHFVLRKILEII